MQILAHRGYWKDPHKKNTREAFIRALESGFGIETDVRDDRGRLVVSHDPPMGEEMAFVDFLDLAAGYIDNFEANGRQIPLAINIKADGLAGQIASSMAGRPFDWFVFDMSVPDMRHHLLVGNPTFARMSEVEPHPIWPLRIAGVWLDAFDGDWHQADTVPALLSSDLRVAIVSPELHGRDHKALWSALRCFKGSNHVLLCTDYPKEAAEFFGSN